MLTVGTFAWTMQCLQVTQRFEVELGFVPQSVSSTALRTVRSRAESMEGTVGLGALYFPVLSATS